MSRLLTWKYIGLHLLAFLVSAFSVALCIITVPATIDLINSASTFAKPDLFAFVLTMSVFMGLFYAKLGSLFALTG